MNSRLLHRVALAILEEPRKFNMTWWTQPDSQSPCGTAACIAGFTVALTKNIETMRELRRSVNICSIPQIARKELEITHEDEQDCRLFGVAYWPCEFREAYYESQTREERADVAFYRIQHYIATEGRE